MNILLTGATGFMGQHLLQALLVAQHQVTVCCRNPNKIQAHPQLTIIKLDFATAELADWLPLLQSVDAVINAVGIIAQSPHASFNQVHHVAACTLFKACEQRGVKKVIQISALGAELSATTAYFTSKAIADAFLKTLAVDWFIFKPSIVYGQGAKSMVLFTALAALPITPLIGDGNQEIQPVFIDDLVNAIVLALQPQCSANQVIDAVGAQPIRFINLQKQLAHWLNQPFRSMAIPVSWLQTIAPLSMWLGEPALNKDAITMLQQGNIAAVDGFAVHLGYQPQSLAYSLQTSRATQAERWQARLYFMRPVLRLSIALVWLWAGVVSAFFYPVAQSYQLLQQVGIHGSVAPLTLYGASLADFCLGLAVLFSWRLRLVVWLQLVLMLSYSVVITAYLPEFWLHPFGPMIKNLPLLCAILVSFILEEERP